MDFDNAKENIQPLAQGRNASILQASLKVESPQELLTQRKQLEKEIHNYSGDDPLSVWFNYIDWIEQSFPSGGKESGLQEVLAKCLSRFESDDRYNQDRRMIKLYIKYIDNLKDPAECYQQLFNAGIGTMVSDFYIAWAYCYDSNSPANNLKAEEIFRRGIACRAQPLEDLQEAHQHFGFVLAQRFMHKDDDNVQEDTNRQLHERRLALSSLRGHRRKQMVGSTRTGAVVKNTTPGTIPNAGPSSLCVRSNARVSVFKDENQSPNFILTPPIEETLGTNEGKSVVRSIIDAQRDQENRKEAGPWNKPHSKGKLFGKASVTNDLGFEIHKDDEEQHEDCDFTSPTTVTQEESKFDKPMKLPPNFCGRNKKPQIVWLTPVTTEELPDKNTITEYNKCKLYPRPNVEFQPEELKAYEFFQRRGIENIFTQKRDMYWGRGPLYNIRHYPHFAKQSNPQKRDSLDDLYVPQKLSGMFVVFDDIYNEKEELERQFEEILAMRLKRNETIIGTTDMEETICVSSEKVQRRKSFFPMRKSIAPCASKGAIPKWSIMERSANVDEIHGEVAMQSSSAVPIFEDGDKVERQRPAKEMITNTTEENITLSSSGLTKPKVYPMASRAEVHEEKIMIGNQIGTRCSPSFPIFEGSAKVEPPNVLSKLHLQPEPQAQKKLSPLASAEAATSNSSHEESFVPIRRSPKTIPQSSELSQDGQVFQFKTPALPPINQPTTSTKSNKVQFEIFEDNANNVDKPEFGSGSGGYFDSDETCSTQTFNIFLRAQSVSTPKQKPEPQRMFGNVLKETITRPETEQKDEEVRSGSTLAVMNPISELGDENSPVAATLFSPQRKQLSTILETSEHGTTQSTHTTGATTKSTISSPEFEQESQAQTITSIQHQPTLDTVKERTMEDSTTPTPSDSTDLNLKQGKGQNDSRVQAQSICATPGVVRFQTGSGGRLDFSIFKDTIENNSNQLGRKDDSNIKAHPTPTTAEYTKLQADSGDHFSIFEDTIENTHKYDDNFPRLDRKGDCYANSQAAPVTGGLKNNQTGSGGRFNFSFSENVMEKNSNQHVGNFSRLEEKEDTAAGFAIKPICFQEDKTETITKMLLLPPPPVIFQEDKTETIPRMMLAPPQAVRFQEDKTETISKILLAPPETVRFEDDKTETISNLLLAPPQPTKYEDETFPKLPSKETSIIESSNQDHFFEFFSQSPPKVGKLASNKPQEIVGHFGHIRTAAENRTPIVIDSKRVCVRNTPDVQKQKSKSTVLFGDGSTKSKSVLRDSFLPDFSLVEEVQTKAKQPKSIKPKSVLRDSFIPDFSLIEDSQPDKPAQMQPPKSTEESFLPDLSHIPETQPTSNESVIAASQSIQGSSSRIKQNSNKNTLQLSYLSHIPETQNNSNDSVIANSQPIQCSSVIRMKQNSIKATLQSSYLPDFSMTTETQPIKNSGEGQPATMKNILTDSFMKDFSEIKEPPPIPKDVKEMTMVQPNKNNSMLKFLEESLISKSNETISKPSNNSSIKRNTSGGKLSFLPPNQPVKTSLGKKSSENEKFFELNAETEMFGTNMSMIKNSTWLPNHGPTIPKNLSQIQENSVHIKSEELSTASTLASSSSKEVAESEEKLITTSVAAANVLQTKLGQSSKSLSSSYQILDNDKSIRIHAAELPKTKLDFLAKSNNVSMSTSRFSIDFSQSEWAIINAKKPLQINQKSNQSTQKSIQSHIINESDDDGDGDFGEMSIYYRHTPKTPKAKVHIWDVPEEDAFKTPVSNRYMHAQTDLNQTHQIIENICVDPNVNPFNTDLITVLLEHIQFTSYIQGLTHCMMVRTIQRLKSSSKISINGIDFEVVKLIGEGAYGAVFCGKEVIGGKKVAMKQENPANLWEFYICLEIRSRVLVDEMLPAFMNIDYALIGNNSSVLISQFSPFGSLIAVCNKIKKNTMKNVDEYVVMLMATELLEIIDHLHAIRIIHADIKADNCLLMKNIMYPATGRSLQLIDFGVSIDMKQFKSNQTFSFEYKDDSFKCIEMREQRPWTYQLDLFGLAGVLHVLLFAKYMEVEKKSSGIWMHKTHVPRYFNRNLWDTIFKALLNIRDCNSMPNLQGLRALLKEEIVEKEKYVIKMVNEFNRALEG